MAILLSMRADGLLINGVYYLSVSKRMNNVRTQLFKRHKSSWILRATMTQPINPRCVEWLKSPFAQRLINKHVSVLGHCHVTHSV